MAANLYAKSIFGEDALANVSLEKNMLKPDAPVTGKFFHHLNANVLAIIKTSFETPVITIYYVHYQFFNLSGHIRIRAKSQGMALSLGDKINSSQKTRSKKPQVVQG